MRFISLPGLTSYEAAHKLMLELVEARAEDRIEDTIVMLEHEPVVTRGRGLQWTGVARERHVPMAPLPAGISFAECERGGDLTAHMPGQLVIYPICKLGPEGELSPRRDIGACVRAIEQVLIDVLAAYGVVATRREGAAGVWVGPEGDPRKVASLGVAVRKWVSWHGAALNVVNSLDIFRLISPCGFSPEVMTRLADITDLGPVTGEPGAWRAELESRLREAFQRVALILQVGPPPLMRTYQSPSLASRMSK